MKKTALLILTVVLCAAAYAQDNGSLIMIFESGEGLGLPVLLDSATVSFRDRNDPNGDGNLDMTLLRDDAMGNPAEIVTFDIVNRREIWSFPLQTVEEALGTANFGFRGFFSFNTDDVWALFKAPDGGAVVTVFVDFTNGKSSADALMVLPARRVVTLDVNGDGATELIIQNSQTRTVQVWGGSGTSTAVQEEIEAAMLRLFQNYPNPFQDRTTIAYEVGRPGPVTITVYDLLGRAVRTLVDETQPVGRYEAAWDGRDAGGQPVASGTYFYRLRVGGRVSSKQAIRVR